MTQFEILDQVISDIDDMKELVKTTFYYIEEDHLQKKPSLDRWSALQCFEHMNLTNKHYLDQLNQLIGKAKPDAGNSNYSTGWISAYMIKNIKPKAGLITNKMKTFKQVKPLAERFENAVVKANPVFTDFFTDLDSFEKLAQDFKGINPQKIKVNSLVGPILKFRGIDAIRFVIGHNERHILQAENALKGK